MFVESATPILLSASAACLSGGVIACAVHVVRKTAEFERPGDGHIHHMIDTAPRGKFDNAPAR